MAKTLKGLLSFEIAPIANDGGVGTVFTAIGSTVKGSMSITGTDAETTDFFIEEQSLPIDSSVTKEPGLEGTYEIYDVDPDTAIKMIPGTVSSSGSGANQKKIFTPAATYNPIEVSAKLTSKNGSVLTIVRLQIIGTFNFQYQDSEMGKITCKVKVLQPTKANTAPYTLSVPNPA